MAGRNPPAPDPRSEREFRAWLQAAHSPAHSRRTAATNAAFFLPKLKPGMRLLDAGCGPGSITAGLAEAVAPGEVVGIDVSATAIENATRAFAGQAHPNLRFEVADIAELPFADASFDAVFLHAVLQHLPDPAGALRRVRRLLRPGGIIGIADADYEGSIIWPSPPEHRRAIELLLRIRGYTGGDLRVGRKLGDLLAAAGFERPELSASASAIGTSEAALREGRWQAAYFASPELRAHSVAVGLATADDLDAASAAWSAWSEAPGAFWARFWCEATAVNPLSLDRDGATGPQ